MCEVFKLNDIIVYFESSSEPVHVIIRNPRMRGEVKLWLLADGKIKWEAGYSAILTKEQIRVYSLLVRRNWNNIVRAWVSRFGNCVFITD